MSHEHESLAPVDAAWFRMEQRGNPVDIAALITFEGPASWELLRQVIEERLVVHARFRRRVVDRGGLLPPQWEDEPGFSVDAHVSRRTLDGDITALVGELTSRPMDLERSPWSLTVIDGVDGDTALFVRIHHCMGDGFALLDRLLAVADPMPGASDVSAPTAKGGDDDTSGGWIAEAAHVARDAKDALAALGHLVVIPFDRESRLRGDLSGERRVAWTSPLDLAAIKRAAHARGGTINDLLLAALSGSLRRYLVAHGDASPEKVRAIMPVNLRPKGVPIDHERGNWFGLVFVDLPTDLADRDERVAVIEREIARLKRSKEALVALGILGVLGRSPAVVDHVVDELFARKASVVATNVPGPRAPLRIAGATVRDMLFWVPHPCGLALGASIFSYAGRVRLGLRSDAAVVPDPATVARLFEEEVSEWTSSDP